MSLCSRPPKTTKTAFATPATKTVNAPPARDETCGPSSSTVISGGGSSTTTTVSVPGPPGPAGPTGPAGECDPCWGFKWMGTWSLNVDYVKQKNATPLASVVGHEGRTWVAVQDNTSITEENPEHEPGVSASWELVAQRGWGLEWKNQFALNQQYYAHSDTRRASVVEYGGSSWIAVADNISSTEESPEHEPGFSPSWELVAQAGVSALNAEEKDFFDSLNDIFDWFKNASIEEIINAGIGAVGVVLAGTAIAGMLIDDGNGDGEADSRYTGSDGLIDDAYVAPDIKEVIAALCGYAAIPYNVSALPDEECMFVIGNTTSIRTILSQLSLAYQFEMVDTGGVLKFVPRSATSVKTLTDDDIGYDKSPVPPSRYTAKRFQGIDLPRSITLNYFSEDTDYNTMTQTSQLFTFPDGQDINLTVPVTMSHEKAKQVTEIALIQSHVERMQYKFTVNYNNVELEPGDVINTPMGSLRISKINELDEGLIEIEGTDAGVAESINVSDLEVAIPPASTNIPVELGYSQAFFIDPPALNDGDSGVRMLAAVHGYDRAGWPGAQLWVSEDGGATYNSVGSTTTQSTVGVVASAIPDRSHLVWDEVTTISVQLKTGSLLSRSELAVLNGENLAQIGAELIGFRNAVLTGPKTYLLSGLLRGRRGTEQFTGTHVPNELFVLMDSSVLRLDWSDSDRGTTKKYKVVTVGSSLDKVDAQDVQMYSNNLRLWTPYDGRIQKIGDDWQLQFKERARFNSELQDGRDAQHDPDWAGFGIAIYNSAGTSIVKTYVSSSELFVYTAAQQITDFGSVQSTLKTKITQLSQKGAPGYPLTLNS